MAILLGDGIKLFLPLFRVINGIQVLPVEFDLELRVRVRRRNDLIAHNHRTRMGPSDDADHENVFSELCVGGRQEKHEQERRQNKRASDRSLEEAIW